MDELIKQVMQKANISEEQARTAVNTVIEFAKTKLPAPLASQLEGLISGGGDLSGGLGGLFGRK